MIPSKLVTLDAAVADIADGATVGLGGWIFNSQPMALVRALVRRGARDLDLVPSPSSIAPDLLIGAGCARSTVCVFISFEQFGLAPHFRRRAEAGTLVVHDLDGPALAGGMRAAICDLPWMPIPDLGTDLPKHAPQFYRPLPQQPGERRMLALLAEFGSETTHEAIEAVLDGAERQVRAVIGAWPDGVYYGEAMIDDDGHRFHDIHIRAKVTKTGSDLEVDLTDCHEEVVGFINSSYANTRSAAVVALAYLIDP
jgi:acyl CoA:acetate/3-ketoacid CoA transferase alpha subunit